MIEKKHKFSKAQRMQLKAFICGLGLLLLLILFMARLILFFVHRKEEPEKEEPVSVVETLKNVWIMEADERNLLVFRDGEKESYPYGTSFALPENAREQIADIELSNGYVTAISLKTEKLSGRILSADGESVEVEGCGSLPLAEDYRGYRIYKSPAMCRASDLSFGYSFADLVLDEGEICGILVVREEAMEYIRVLVKTSDYQGIFHNSLTITSDTDFTVQYGSYEKMQQESFSAGEEITVDAKSQYFSGERVYITPDVLTGKLTLKNISRSQGTPAYRGRLELLKAEEGLVAVNEVLLEEYLYSVVPSEMPASYPPEALKAQAVCARTYAYGFMLKAGYPQYGAHVDDSTSYQVYNNILERESATTAVRETYGQLLRTAEGELAGAYYYSTSCGVGSDANVWKTKEAQSLDYLQAKPVNAVYMENLLRGENPGQKEQAEGEQQDGQNEETDGQPAGQGNPESLGEQLKQEEVFAEFIRSKNAGDFEVSEGWYRWSYQVRKINTESMLEALKKRYEANKELVLTLCEGEFVSRPVEELDCVAGLSVVSRGSGGVAEELLIETGKHTYKVMTEYNIRSVLCDGESKVLRQDGSEASAPNLLPSGFFILTAGREKENVVGYTLTGGGFGHGVGMSQNGARAMAAEGYSAHEILSFFYENCTIENVYGEG